MITLKKHQQKPVNFLKNNFGILLYHSTGSGKTITSLVGAYQFDKPIIIIGPRSAEKAFNDEIKKLNYNPSRFTIYTYQKLKTIMYDDIDIFKDKFVIVDEAHHLRSPTTHNIFLTGLLINAFKVILLTATPIINYLNDIAPLINVIKRNEVLPNDRELFNFFYFDERNLELINEHLLYDKFKNTLSYYSMENDDNYPKSQTVIKKIRMSQEQLDEYIRFVKHILCEKDAPGLCEDFLNIDFDALKTRKKNAFLNATRQLSNTIDKRVDQPKIKAVYDEIVNGPKPVVVYSNYKANGVFVIGKILNEHNIDYKIITGSTGSDKINIIVNDYNNKKFNVLLITSAGSESLDLKNTRQIHILEPHWNDQKIKQVIGRAIRYKSHSDLPLNERNVTIYKWISIFPKPYLNMSADEYLTMISEKKMAIFDTFKKIIIESSIENNSSSENKIKNIGGNIYSYKKYKSRYIKLKNKSINNKNNAMSWMQ